MIKMKNTAVKDLLEMVRDKQESGQLQWFDEKKEDKEKRTGEKEDKEKKDKPDAGAAVKGNSGGNCRRRFEEPGYG